MADAGNVNVRFSASDQETVRRALEALGKDGEAALRKFDAAGKQPSRTMQALGDVFGQLRSQANASAQSLGLAGDVLLRFGPVGLVVGTVIGTIGGLLFAASERAKAFRQSSLEMVRGAEEVGLSVRHFEAVTYALQKQGVETDAARGALFKFNVGREQASRSQGDLYERLRDVNPEIARQFALASSTAQAWDIYANAIKSAVGPQQQALLRAGLGRAGGQFFSAILDIDKNGGLDTFTRGAEKAGRIFAEEQRKAQADVAKAAAERSKQTEDAWTQAALNVTGAWKRFWDKVYGAEEETRAVAVARSAKSLTDYLFGKEPQSEADRLQKKIDEIGQKIEKLRTLQQNPLGLGLAPTSAMQVLAGISLDKQIEAAERKQQDLKNRLAVAPVPTTATAPPSGALPARMADRWAGLDPAAIAAGLTQVQGLDREIDVARNGVATLRKAIELASDPKDVMRLTGEFDRLNKKLGDLQRQRPEVARRQEITELTGEIEALEKLIARKGDQVSIEDKLALAAKQRRLADLERPDVASQLPADVRARVAEAERLQLDSAQTAKRVQLGVSREINGEDERAINFKRELNLLVANQTITQDEATRSLAQYKKTLKETIDQEQVRRSTTPALTQLAIDAGNFNKTLDQELAGGLRGLTGDLKQVRDGAISAGQGIKQMGMRILDAVQNAIAMKLIVAPLANLLSGGLTGGIGGLFGLTRSALGNVFSNSIVDRPTLFPMASGAGLMGEAGPEAVMPLMRMVDGRLGIAAAGGGGGRSITQHIYVTGATGNTEIKQMVAEGVSQANATAAGMLGEYDRGLPNRFADMSARNL